MFNNFIKIAFRNLKRRKVSTAITATGLIIGITAFLFILQFVAFEFSVNKHHQQADNIYRVVGQFDNGESSEFQPPALAPSIADQLAGVSNGTRFSTGICSGIIEVESANSTTPGVFRENSCMYADEQLFDVFSIDLIEGVPDLETPSTAIISIDLARKYFGRENVTGEELTLYNQFGDITYTIVGVMRNMPKTSSIDFGILLSFNTLMNNQNAQWADPMGWDNGFAHHYILLEDGINPINIENEINDIAATVIPNIKVTFRLQPFNEIHLGSGFNYQYPTSGSLVQVLLILGVGIMIMIIGWANYINLSTAQGLERSKQVGIQQTAGASKIQLMSQFLIETFLFSAFSLAVSIAMVELLQPYFNQLIDKPLSLSILNFQFMWIFGALFFIAGTIAAGGYVAFVLTSLRPSEILKGASGTSSKGLRLRKILVVFQFAISIALIVVTAVFVNQLRFMQTQDLGMDLENRMVVRGPSINKEGQNQSTDAFKDQIANFSFVNRFAGSNNVPGNGYNFSATGITNQNPQPGDERKSFSMLIIDENYLNAYGINLASGRNFNTEAINAGWGSDNLIVNESAATVLGFSSATDAIDQIILWGDNQYRIVGVVEDYHHASLQELIEPMVFIPSNSNVYFTLELTGANLRESIAEVRNTYEAYYPGNPFEYFFIADEYDKQYVAEQRFSNLFLIAASLAIFIACLGLFGLAAYTATSRTKEIGVRKVLGATVLDITLLLTRDFVLLVIFGFFIAAPIAWYLMSEWLKNFAYTIELGLGIFLIAGFIALTIAVATVAGRAIQAATLNPVESLRSE
jgi:putative ABC transport system permease protein